MMVGIAQGKVAGIKVLSHWKPPAWDQRIKRMGFAAKRSGKADWENLRL